MSAIWAVREELAEVFFETARFALLFTVRAMHVGTLIGSMIAPNDRPVVVIESTVRNIPVAVLVGGGAAVTPAFAGFVATYVLVEVALMISYALLLRNMSAIVI